MVDSKHMIYTIVCGFMQRLKSSLPSGFFSRIPEEEAEPWMEIITRCDKRDAAQKTALQEEGGTEDSKLAMFDLEGAILKSGTEALLECAKMSGIASENVTPERVMQASMVRRFVDDLGWDARSEVNMMKMLRELGCVGDWTAITRDVGGYKADIVKYENNLPVLIIEIKKVLKKKDTDKVFDDVVRLYRLSKHVKIKCYLALAIFDDVRTPVDRQVKRLEEKLGHDVRTGPLHKDFHTGQWDWCFGCVTLDPGKLAALGLAQFPLQQEHASAIVVEPPSIAVPTGTGAG